MASVRGGCNSSRVLERASASSQVVVCVCCGGSKGVR